jgi:hypothetical protein
LIASVGAAACYSPSPTPGLPCADDRQCPDGQVCSPSEVCVSAGSVRALHDDSSDDFDHPDATLSHAVITARGAVESAPWMTYGMRVTAIDSAAFDDDAAASWDELIARPIVGQGYLYSTQISWSDTSSPAGLGLTRGTDVTVLLEGEIFLDAGTWRLALRADDVGFLDIAEPDTASFRRVLTANYEAEVPGTFEAKVEGWYPVRMATANRNGAGNIFLTGTTGNGTPGTLSAARLRAQVPGSAAGLVQDAFDSPGLLYFRTTKLAADIRDLSFGAAAPPDSGISSSGSYSLRWGGQFFLEDQLDGFTLTTEGAGHRLWIDGRLLADKLSTNGDVSTLVDLDLQPGWHDLVIDLEKSAPATAAMRITEVKGDADAFAPDRLRPVLGQRQRWLAARNSTALPIPADGTATRSLFLPSIPGTVLAATAEVTISHTAFPDLSLAARWGSTTRTLAATGSLTGTGRLTRTYALDPKDYSPTPGSTWAFTVTDAPTVAGSTGTIDQAVVSVSYTATAASSLPLSPVATYISSPRELDEPVALGKASWKQHAAEGATVEVALRTCATAEACASAEWHPVNDEGLSTALPDRFVQYRVVLTSTGQAAAALDSFTLEYYSGED